MPKWFRRAELSAADRTSPAVVRLCSACIVRSSGIPVNAVSGRSKATASVGQICTLPTSSDFGYH